MFLFGMAVFFSSPDSLKHLSKTDKVLKSLPWFALWTFIYWGVLAMSTSGDINCLVRDNVTDKLSEKDKILITSFVSSSELKASLSSGVFSVDASARTDGYAHYLQLYSDGSERSDKILVSRLFLVEEPIKIAHLAKLKATPKVPIWKRILYYPPFPMGYYDTKFYRVHLPPGSIHRKFQVELK